MEKNSVSIVTIIGLSVYAITRMYRYTDGPFDIFLELRKLFGFIYSEEVDGNQVYIKEIAPDDSMFGKLVSCTWCLSFWLSVLACVLTRKPLRLFLAATGLSGFLHEMSDG